MGLREFGRWVNKTGEAVRKAIATGKIPADCVGQRKLKTGPGRMVPVITNPERARVCWGQRVDPNQVRDKQVLSEGRAAAHARARGEEPKLRAKAAMAASSIEIPTEAEVDGEAVPSIGASKAITAYYEAKTARVLHEEKIGKLVDAEKIKQRYVELIKTAQGKLRGVPSTAKGQIPTLTVRDIEVLEDLIDEALGELALGR